MRRWPSLSAPSSRFSGDGGFLYNSQELATAVQHGINAVVVVFNDNAYGNVLRDQMTRFNGRVIGAELHNPDFVRLAEAYGARGVRAEGADALELAPQGRRWPSRRRRSSRCPWAPCRRRSRPRWGHAP